MKKSKPESADTSHTISDETSRSRVELASLLEISQALNRSLELGDILNRLLLVILGRLMISRGLVLLREPSNGLLKPACARGIKPAALPEPVLVQNLPTRFFHIRPSSAQPLPDTLVGLMKQRGLVAGLPIVHQDRVLGLVLLGPRLNGDTFGEEEVRFLASLASLAGMSIHNALQVAQIQSVNQQLDFRIQQLRTLFELTQALSSTLNTDQVLKTLTYALMGQFLVNHHAVILFEEAGPLLVRSQGLEARPLLSLLQEGLAECKDGRAQMVRALPAGPLRKALIHAGVEVLLPLFHQERCSGVVLLGGRANGQPYRETDLEFLATLGSQAAISLENARLFSASLEKQRMEEELNVARAIQQRLLPGKIVQPPGYRMAGRNVPTRQVGGDYFDVIPVQGHRIALMVADVSGKGVPAALLMANLQAAFRLIIHEPLSLSEMAGRLNRLIYQNTAIEQFATAFLALLDVAAHTLTYVNAGHNYPLLVQANGRLTLLKSTGTILGLLPEYQFQEATVSLQPQDLLVIYTDGINEAVNDRQEEFGEDRLRKLIQQKAHLPPEQLLAAILNEVNRYAGDLPQADDMTLLIVRREA